MMPPGHSSEPREAVAQRAGVFFERRRFGKWNDADQAELDAWFAESILHQVAYLRLEGAVAHTEELVTLLPFDAEPASGRAAPDNRRKLRLGRLAFPFLAAASLAVAAPFAGRFMAYLMQPPDRTDSTDVGGRTLLSFSDHTQIELNTATAVRLRMTTKERMVWLEKGEAWFQVAHDAAHPFTVIVGTHRVTDLGTEFLIRRDGDAVDVTLLKGRASLSADGAQIATLNPGEEAVATPASLVVTRKSPQELADELAWRQGMLVFRKTPLNEVVKEFNRYNTVKLVIADPSIANVRIAAKLRADNYESFLALAENVLKLRVDREGDTIFISRGQPETTKKAVRVKHGD